MHTVRHTRGIPQCAESADMRTVLVPSCELGQVGGRFARMSTTHDFVQRVPELAMRHRLYLARETSGMTQTELADQMGVSRRTIGNCETGAKVPRRPTLAAWSLATGVPLVWLETGETPSPGDGDGASVVRHQGLEPRTRWLEASAGQGAAVIEFRRAA